MGTWVVRNVTLRMVAIILDKPHRQHERRYDGSPDDNAQEDEKLLGSARTSVTICQVIGSLPSARTHFTHWGLPSSDRALEQQATVVVERPDLGATLFDAPRRIGDSDREKPARASQSP